ncbi:Flavonoid 3'-monooxygenase [Acorus calamus]|uniref:Flavonoid 3'-monooxygenase n=1 Tax=Acorus calamus TaxID=4465 RepID=A0AAV9C9S2_ACOCL|nr:Flavonoid 3'-monooxygenase [Acorus calamus]
MAIILNQFLESLHAPFLWAVTAVLLFLITTSTKGAKKLKLPPSPPGLPIIGNLHQLGRLPHHALRDIARKHGPIVYLRLGHARAVVASSTEAASQFLKTHDRIFAGRPQFDAGELMAYGSRDITFSNYGPHWRNIKKICAIKLFSARKIDSLRWLRKEEVALLLQSIGDSARLREPVNVASAIASLNTGMMCRILFGSKLEEGSMLRSAVREALKLAGAFNLGDYFPVIRGLDIQGLRRRMKEVHGMMDAFLDRKIEERIGSDVGPETMTQQDGDFIDVLLAELVDGGADSPLDCMAVKAIIVDMLVGGIDSGTVIMEWILSELMKKPQSMKKLQNEIESVVGLDRMVDESDLPKLGYLDMVVKEGFRLHPPGPLLVPHLAVEDSVIMGYDIPKNTHVMVNVWAIGRDPKYWADPEEFYPERFMDSNVDISGTDLRVIPFGSGRRLCPGVYMGMMVVRLVIAQMVHCFDWELPNGMSPEDLDMEEEYGLTVFRKNSLVAVPTHRLRGDVA